MNDIVKYMTPNELEEIVGASQMTFKLERKGFVSLAVDSSGLPNYQ
jgi:hypothetical protein